MPSVRVIAIYPHGKIRGDAVSALPGADRAAAPWSGFVSSEGAYPTIYSDNLPAEYFNAAAFEFRHFH
eukprot:1812780-Lingulodinium_polyedra.AAC.1